MKKITCVRLTEENRTFLEKLAKQRGCTITAVINHAITEQHRIKYHGHAETRHEQEP